MKVYNGIQIPHPLPWLHHFWQSWNHNFAEIAEFYNFHQRNPTSQHTALLHLIYSVITLKNWSFTFLLYYHRLERRTLEYLLQYIRMSVQTPVTVFTPRWINFSSSSTLSLQLSTPFIQLDTRHFEKSLLVKFTLEHNLKPQSIHLVNRSYIIIFKTRVLFTHIYKYLTVLFLYFKCNISHVLSFLGSLVFLVFSWSISVYDPQTIQAKQDQNGSNAEGESAKEYLCYRKWYFSFKVRKY